MNFLSAKLSRILRIFREGNVLQGIKIVSGQFLDFVKMSFSWTGKGDILFVVGGVGATSLYRGHNVAEELEMHGFKCKVVLQNNPFLKKFSRNYEVFVFHRTLYTPLIEGFVKNIKAQNKEIIFDADDLLFDSQYLKKIDYLKNVSEVEKKLYQEGLGGEIINDPYVRVCTSPTNFLRKKMESLGKKTFLVPNRINNNELELAEKLFYKKNKKEGVVKIGYFSGTMSHNRDFATIVEPLERIMDKYDNVELFLAGPLERQNVLMKFGDRIKIIPFSSRKDNYRNILRMDVNLFPLEMGNPFCEAKSELKFFEAGVLGVCTIASATGTLKEAIIDGVDGFIASDENEWFLKLEKLILDGDFRESLSKKAREKSIEKYTNKNSNNENYYSFLRSRIKK